MAGQGFSYVLYAPFAYNRLYGVSKICKGELVLLGGVLQRLLVSTYANAGCGLPPWRRRQSQPTTCLHIHKLFTAALLKLQLPLSPSQKRLKLLLSPYLNFPGKKSIRDPAYNFLLFWQ